MDNNPFGRGGGRRKRQEVSVPPALHRHLNLKGVSEYYDLTGIAKQDYFKYQGIWIFTGGQGTGKTLNLIHTVRDIYKQYPEAKIISNIPLFGIPYEQYHDIEDFNTYFNGQKGIIFVLDEIQTLYSSLKSKNMDDAELFVWSQNRKNRRVILGTSQRFSRVAKPIREQTCYHIECGRKIGPFHRYRVYDGYAYNDDGEYEGDTPKWKFYIPNARSMLSYDTHFVVNPSGG